MRALQLVNFQQEPVVMTVPKPTPGPGEVVITVGAAGACHSDLHIMYDIDPAHAPWPLPFTLGHENAGWVHTVGQGVSRLFGWNDAREQLRQMYTAAEEDTIRAEYET